MDKEYIDILNDVVIRFCAHHSYKTKEGALKALVKRTGKFQGVSNSENLDQAIAIYTKAAELISSGHYTDRSANTTIYSAYEDILFDKCLSELQKQVPNSDEQLASAILNWIIFWYYLK
ncbi:MAG: hypothetical protein V4506_13440 [Bacteroidota bacterium]